MTWLSSRAIELGIQNRPVDYRAVLLCAPTGVPYVNVS